MLHNDTGNINHIVFNISSIEVAAIAGIRKDFILLNIPDAGTHRRTLSCFILRAQTMGWIHQLHAHQPALMYKWGHLTAAIDGTKFLDYRESPYHLCCAIIVNFYHRRSLLS